MNKWDIINEGGEGYRPTQSDAPERTPENIRIIIADLECRLLNAHNAGANGGHIAAKIEALRAELPAEETPEAVKARADVTFAAEWTAEVTASRRAAWNAEIRKQKSWTATQLVALEKRLGFGANALKRAIKLYE